MPTTNYTGADVLDEHGAKIGSVSDVIYEEAETIPTWLVVKPGLLRAEHYVPSLGSYRTEGDDIVVPYSADQVKAAPKAKRDHVLDNRVRDRLGRHYRLAD